MIRFMGPVCFTLWDLYDSFYRTCMIHFIGPVWFILWDLYDSFYGTCMIHYRVLRRPPLEPDKYSLRPHPIWWKLIQILSSHLLLGLKVGLFSSGLSLTKSLYGPRHYAIRATCRTHLILIWSPEKFLERKTNPEAPHYAVFSIPLLPSAT